MRTKRLIANILVVICLVLTLVPNALAAVTFVTTDAVNVRSGPSTDSSVVKGIYSNTSVEVLEHDPAGWSKVQVHGSTGYIRSDFLAVKSGSGNTTFKTTDGVNLRAGASTTDRILTTLNPGANVEMLNHDPAGWSRIRIDGTVGYVRSDFLTIPGLSPASGTSGTSSSSQPSLTLRTTGVVNLRAGASTNDRILMSVGLGINVEVLEQKSNGWSKVKVEGTTGFIRSDLLTTPGTSVAGASVGGQSALHLRTTGAVNLRSGPSTDNNVISVLPTGVRVEVLEQNSNGWSKVNANGSTGYIRSDLLRSDTSGSSVELVEISTARGVAKSGNTVRIYDLRTGISYNLRVLSPSGHLDVEPPTKADTDALFSTFGGKWAWAPRPVWVTVPGGRTFAAAMTGMPHAGTTIPDNGVNGHFCLHFLNTVTNNKSYQADLRAAVSQAWNYR